jgi:site-specific DNA recombinase
VSKNLFRCAIYTRKSTEEGLEQAFNSLDAQREACAAYIASQVGLGWKVISKHYDDGGLSGGTMERPALQNLLKDIAARRVDVVVVYKIDRLTRSLMDFTRIVEVFDRHQVSFVSVTQQFNTSTSMGRLTLNVLLSFAQFEREVTAERIRDKIAASKKKGMWMGGPVPIGYRATDKRLVVEPEEAEVVRQLFRLYLEIGSVRRLKEKVDELRLVTSKRWLRNDEATGGKSFSRGHLYWLLSNPIYVGDVRHRGKVWPGQHEPIIDRGLWDTVQKSLSEQAPVQRGARLRRKGLLTGLLYDETGDRLSPSHAVKNRKRYCYYISHRLMQRRKRDEGGWRLPANALEMAVLTGLAERLRDEGWLVETIGLKERGPAAVRQALHRAAEIATSLIAQPWLSHDLLRLVVRKIVVGPQEVNLTLSRPGLCDALGIIADPLLEPADISVKLTFGLRRRGVEARLMIGGGEPRSSCIDTKLVESIAQAHHWMDRLTNGLGISVADIAREAGMDDGEISRVLPLAFLAPDIITAILHGRQPVELTARQLKRLKPLPLSWADQRRVLGFAAVN